MLQEQRAARAVQEKQEDMDDRYIFETWLKDLDRKLKRKKPTVLLFLDNVSDHTNIKLEQIYSSSLLIQLPNHRFVLQNPMDQGIIENLKVHYRRFLLRDRISAIDDDRQYKINLVHALQFLRRSWDAVKPETWSRCFRKAGFVINEEPEDNDEDGENIFADMDRLWKELQANNDVQGNLADYLAVDNQLETGGALSLAEIAEDVRNKDVEETEVDSDSEVVEIEEEEPSLPKKPAKP